MKAFNLFRLLENKMFKLFSMQENKFNGTKVCEAEEVKKYFVNLKVENELFG